MERVSVDGVDFDIECNRERTQISLRTETRGLIWAAVFETRTLSSVEDIGRSLQLPSGLLADRERRWHACNEILKIVRKHQAPFGVATEPIEPDKYGRVLVAGVPFPAVKGSGSVGFPPTKDYEGFEAKVGDYVEQVQGFEIAFRFRPATLINLALRKHGATLWQGFFRDADGSADFLTGFDMTLDQFGVDVDASFVNGLRARYKQARADQEPPPSIEFSVDEAKDIAEKLANAAAFLAHFDRTPGANETILRTFRLVRGKLIDAGIEVDD